MGITQFYLSHYLSPQYWDWQNYIFKSVTVSV